MSSAVGRSDEVMESISDYISCISGGIEADCGRIREELQEELNSDLVLNCIGQALRALIQWVNLVFVIQSSDVKAVYKKFVGSISCYN